MRVTPINPNNGSVVSFTFKGNSDAEGTVKNPNIKMNKITDDEKDTFVKSNLPRDGKGQE